MKSESLQIVEKCDLFEVMLGQTHIDRLTILKMGSTSGLKWSKVTEAWNNFLTVGFTASPFKQNWSEKRKSIYLTIKGGQKNFSLHSRGNMKNNFQVKVEGPRPRMPMYVTSCEGTYAT